MRKKLLLEKEIEELNLDSKITKILKENNIIFIKDVWILKRQDLKKMSLTDSDITQVSIKLQLYGLDLNKKIY